MRLGIYFRKEVSQVYSLVKRIIGFVSENRHEVYIEKSISHHFPGLPRFEIERASDYIDYLVVVGGDGTLIKALHMMGDSDVPIVAVRSGYRGALLDISPVEVEDRLRDLFEKRYVLREYDRIYAVTRSGPTPPALNEILLTPSIDYLRSRVIRLNVYKDDHLVYSLEGDGVIVSTPLGSTAYSLSAGGPVIDHSVRAMVITPLASIHLWARPVVVSIDSIVRILVRVDSVAGEVIVDGSFRAPVSPGEEVVVRRYPRPARIVRFHRDEEIYERIFERR